MINKIKCYFGFHKVYTDADYANESPENMEEMANKYVNQGFDCVDTFFEICALRCRHCDWTYKSTRIKAGGNEL